MKCPKCGNENQSDAVFCDQCGQRLAQPVTPLPEAVSADQPTAQAGTCTRCGGVNTPGELFCGECGAPLEGPAPEAAAVAAAPAVMQPVVEPVALACPRCGAQAEPDDAFCAKCGAALAAASTTETGQPTATVNEQTAEPAPAEPSVAPAPVLSPEASQSLGEPEAAPSAPSECPSCGAHVAPEDAFCDFCGAALVGPAAATVTSSAPAASSATPAKAETGMPPAQPADLTATAAVTAPTPVGPHLLVPDSGATIALSGPGEVLVGREDPFSNTFPDVDLTPHGGEAGGVSRRHFKITVGEGQFAIQDLNSTNATWLNRTRLQPGLPVALHDGDEIRAGKVKLVFRAG